MQTNQIANHPTDGDARHEAPNDARYEAPKFEVIDLTDSVGQQAKASLLVCWVAREVYGLTDYRWIQFRHWLIGSAPVWFRTLYVQYGAGFARWIRNKPMLKAVIRAWMNTRIAR